MITNKERKTVDINVNQYMLTAPFVVGFRDSRQKLPYPRNYETTMAKPFHLNKKVILYSGQEVYENGRLFACEYKGKLLRNHKVTIEAHEAFVVYLKTIFTSETV